MEPMTTAFVISAAMKFATKLGEKDAYREQAAAQMQQAAVYRRNAMIVRQNGSLKENSMRSEKRATVASMSAMAGENGMGESPTTVTALATVSAGMENNILYDRFRGESEAENYLYQARIAEEQASNLKKKSKFGIADVFSLGGELGAFNSMEKN